MKLDEEKATMRAIDELKKLQGLWSEAIKNVKKFSQEKASKG